MEKKQYTRPVSTPHAIKTNGAFLLTQSDITILSDPIDATEPEEVKRESHSLWDELW